MTAEGRLQNAARWIKGAKGLDGHEVVMMVHTDTGHKHLHVVGNRVHPETGMAAKLDDSKLRLQRCALDYELRQGRIRCPARLDQTKRKSRTPRGARERTPEERAEWRGLLTEQAAERDQHGLTPERKRKHQRDGAELGRRQEFRKRRQDALEEIDATRTGRQRLDAKLKVAAPGRPASDRFDAAAGWKAIHETIKELTADFEEREANLRNSPGGADILAEVQEEGLGPGFLLFGVRQPTLPRREKILETAEGWQRFQENLVAYGKQLEFESRESVVKEIPGGRWIFEMKLTELCPNWRQLPGTSRTFDSS